MVESRENCVVCDEPDSPVYSLTEPFARTVALCVDHRPHAKEIRRKREQAAYALLPELLAVFDDPDEETDPSWETVAARHRREAEVLDRIRVLLGEEPTDATGQLPDETVSLTHSIERATDAWKREEATDATNA